MHDLYVVYTIIVRVYLIATCIDYSRVALIATSISGTLCLIGQKLVHQESSLHILIKN